MQIHLTTHDLRRLFAPVIPFAGTDGMLPVLTGIHVRSKGEYLTAVTTDRYRVAMCRVKPEIAVHSETSEVKAWPLNQIPAPGQTIPAEPGTEHRKARPEDTSAVPWVRHAPPTGVDFLIPVAQVKRMLALFKAPRHTYPTPVVTLTVDGTSCTVSGGQDLAGEASVTMTFTLLDGEYPKVDSIFTKEFAVPDADRSPEVGLNPKFLAAFSTACTVHGENVVGLKTSRPGSPIIGFVGDDFVGLIMPRRLLDAPPTSGALDATTKEWATFLS